MGLGSILIQFDEKNEPRIIAYASKSLTQVEQKYYQTEREALAIVWAIEKFHYYLYGRKFELITDCKVLERLYAPTSKPCLRMERWVLRMQAYQFRVIHRPGKSNLADPLSRLAVVTNNEDVGREASLVMYVREASPNAISLGEIEKMSLNDEILELVKEALKSQSWEDVPEEFARFKDELCQVGEIVLRSGRIVIPKELQQRIVEIGHTGHPGIVQMKSRMRAKVWFPNMDKLIEEKVKRCLGCLMTAKADPPDPIAIKQLPKKPWAEIAIDFKEALPNGNSLLVAIDYFSRFVQIAEMAKTEAKDTISALKMMFAYAGLPEIITSDNGPQFTSTEFKEFCEKENIKHKLTTPYYPSMNGEVERFNRNIKKRLQISHVDGTNWKNDLADYLLAYNNAIHSTTGSSPAMLMYGRELRDRLPNWEEENQDYLYEGTRDKDLRMKEKRKIYADRKRKAVPNQIEEGDTVLLKNQMKESSLSTNFGPEKFTVIKDKGAEKIVESQNTKKTYRRNASHMKKVVDEVPQNFFEEKEGSVGDAIKGTSEATKPVRRSNRAKERPKHLEDFVE